MSKKKGVPYPVAQLQAYDTIWIDNVDFQVIAIYMGQAIFTDHTMKPITETVRLIRKEGGPTYETWQRRTSKILKAMGLSKWPGDVMHQYFFDSVSPEEAAAGFMSDHFEVDFIPIKFMEQ